MSEKVDPNYRIDDAVEQLCRYEGTPRSEKFYEVLEALASLNDDLCHLRHREVCQDQANVIKNLIDDIMKDYKD